MSIGRYIPIIEIIPKGMRVVLVLSSSGSLMKIAWCNN